MDLKTAIDSILVDEGISLEIIDCYEYDELEGFAKEICDARNESLKDFILDIFEREDAL